MSHHYLHHIPGRLRVKCASLKRNEQKVRRVCDYLRGIDGVVEAEANALTGSLLVRYDTDVVRSETLLNSLKALDCVHHQTDVSRPITDITRPFVQRVADQVVQKAVEALIERSAVALVAAII
jgi:hypothetical protein